MKNFESSDIHKQGEKDEGAKRFDSMKVRWDLIPYDALEKVAEVFTHGAAKYEDNNWRKGMSYSRMYGPIYRHLSKSIRGEDLDPDSYCFHLGQVAWGAICLLWFQMNNIGNDDRVKDLEDPELSYYGKVDKNRQQTKFWEIIKYWKDKRMNDPINDNFKIKRKKDVEDGVRKSISIKNGTQNNPKEGERYRHFKGNVYEIICVSFNTEGDNEALVTYKEIHGNQKWTRPLSMFKDRVEDPLDKTNMVKRFTKI